MPQAYSAEANVVGAFALTLGERVRLAVEDACAIAGAPAVAVVALHEFAEGDSIALLARVLGVSHSRAVRVVDRLESERWARRRADPADGRTVAVELTARGRRTASRALRAREAVLTSFLGGLAVDELRTLGRIAGAALGEQAVSREAARRICRLCDTGACGHSEGRCPVTEARRARNPAA